MFGVAESNKDSLLLLGEIICKYNMESSVGVSLVHRHHSLEKDERLIWQIVGDSIWSAEPRNKPDPNIIPIMWKVGLSKNGPSLYPLEFCESGISYRHERTISDSVTSNRSFVEEFMNTAVREEV